MEPLEVPNREGWESPTRDDLNGHASWSPLRGSLYPRYIVVDSQGKQWVRKRPSQDAEHTATTTGPVAGTGSDATTWVSGKVKAAVEGSTDVSCAKGEGGSSDWESQIHSRPRAAAPRDLAVRPPSFDKAALGDDRIAIVGRLEDVDVELAGLERMRVDLEVQKARLRRHLQLVTEAMER